jgi:hypothetical protein
MKLVNYISLFLLAYQINNTTHTNQRALQKMDTRALLIIKKHLPIGKNHVGCPRPYASLAFMSVATLQMLSLFIPCGWSGGASNDFHHISDLKLQKAVVVPNNPIGLGSANYHVCYDVSVRPSKNCLTKSPLKTFS